MRFARPCFLLTPDADKNPKGFISGALQITAVSHATMAGVGSPFGELTTTAIGVDSELGSATPIGELILTAFANRFYGSADIIGELVATDESLSAKGGAIDIYDEGILVQLAASSLNFIGADVKADVGTLDPTGAKVMIPPPTYVSLWDSTSGTTIATVQDVATANRYIASPTAEGTPFYTGGGVAWGGDGATHPSTRTSPLIWTPGSGAGNLVLFEDTLSTFTVTFSNSSGVIETYTTGAISGNSINTVGNITVTITNWATDSDKYKANVSVSVDITSMLPNSGYFDVLIRHSNGGTNYDYTQ